MSVARRVSTQFLANAIAGRVHRWARRRQGIDTPPVAFGRRRVYILPTRFGAIYAAIVFTMLLGSMNYNNSLGFALTFLLTGLGLVAMHHCHRNLAGLVVSGVHGGETFAGEALRLQIGLENPSALPRLELTVECDERQAIVHRIEPSDRALIDIELPAQPRGLWRRERLAVSTRFPFGLFRAWSWLHLPIEVIVYPRPAGTQAPPLAAAATGDYGSRHTSRGGSEDFHGFRTYSQGDSPRHIAWKALARGGPLLVKEYADASEAAKIYDFDTVRLQDREARLSQLCRWIVEADRRCTAFGVKLPDRFIAASSGAAHRRRCLSALALFGMDIKHG